MCASYNGRLTQVKVTMNRTRKLIVAALALVVLVVAVVAIIGATNAPASSSVTVRACLTVDDGACVRFPSVTGTNLVGDAFTLPDDFAGTLTLVLMPFDEAQTVRSAAWLPMAQELADAHPQFAYYSVPVMKSVVPLIRMAVVGGMVMVVPADVQPITIMLFLEDKQAFLDALAVPDIETPEAFLLNDAGEVLWRYRGEYSDEADASLRTAVEAALE